MTSEVRERARKLYPRSSAFEAAYVSGAQAALNGRSRRACPYGLEKLAPTWRSAYRIAWMRGWSSVGAEAEDDG